MSGATISLAQSVNQIDEPINLGSRPYLIRQILRFDISKMRSAESDTIA